MRFFAAFHFHRQRTSNFSPDVGQVVLPVYHPLQDIKKRLSAELILEYQFFIKNSITWIGALDAGGLVWIWMQIVKVKIIFYGEWRKKCFVLSILTLHFLESLTRRVILINLKSKVIWYPEERRVRFTE